MGRFGEVLYGLKPVILMVLVQIILSGVTIFYKLAANDGMNMKVLVAYRWIFASAFTVPLALIFERKNRPKFTWEVLLLSFLNGLFGGFLTQNLMAESLVFTSATYVAAITNLIPCVTLIISAVFGIEKLGLKTRLGKLKVIGILIGIGGTMVVTFYKGAELKIWPTNFHLLKQNNETQKSHSTSSNHQILGCFLAFCSVVAFALWLIVQGKLTKIYPRHYTVAASMSLMSSVQSLILALCMERDWREWKLGWNLRLLIVFYLGIISSGLMVIFVGIGLAMRGPVFVSSFSPLSLVLTAIASSLVLQEMLHLGTIIGGVLIVFGLYVVLWSQNKEMKEKAKLVPTQPQLIDIVVFHNCIHEEDSSSSKELQNS